MKFHMPDEIFESSEKTKKNVGERRERLEKNWDFMFTKSIFILLEKFRGPARRNL